MGKKLERIPPAEVHVTQNETFVGQEFEENDLATNIGENVIEPFEDSVWSHPTYKQR